VNSFNYPVKPPLSAHGYSLAIKRLTAERDALLAMLQAMLPLMEWSTTAQREPVVEAARELIARQGPPDPTDWSY
jgi:hypothetical protein